MTIDFKNIINELDSASLFDLHRISCAIDKMMGDSKKISLFKKQIKPGIPVTYFDPNENRLINAAVVEIRQTRVTVLNHEDNKRWGIPLYWLNIQGVDTEIRSINSGTGSLNKANLKLNETVGWFCTRDNEEKFGVVIKINPKRAQIKIACGDIWNVAYPLLFPVIDGEQDKNPGLLIEGEVIGS